MVLKGANELLTNFLSISSVNNFLTIQKDIVKSDTIEKDYGQFLDWKRKDEYLHCRVQFEEPKIFSVSDKHSWDKMINLMTDKMVKLENAFKGHLLTLKIIKKE